MRLIGVGQMYDGDDDATQPNSRLHLRDQAALKIVTVADEIIRAWLDLEFAAFEIGDSGVDVELLLTRSLLEDFDRKGRAIDRSDAPTVPRQEQGIAAHSASQVECASNLKLLAEASDQG